VAVLVKVTGADGDKSAATGDFDEESLQKARRILNGMMEQAWKELDDIIFECKEFEERNRGTYDQVVGDLARLGSQLAILGERRVTASEGIFEQDRLRKESEAMIEKETSKFEQTRLVNQQEMTIRTNDLAVFDMILMMTKCQDSESQLVQLGSLKVNRSEHDMQICNSNGGLEIRFNDPQLQAKVERLMTPDARHALREALGQEQMTLMQVVKEKAQTSMANTTTPGLPTVAIEVSPVVEAPSASGQAKKCVDGEPNCGLLHDLMSMEWGKFRDAFDELANEMKHNQDAFDLMMGNLNEQLTVINDARTKHMESLADAISAINQDTEEMNNKDEQKRDLQHEYDQRMEEFRAKCTEILYTRICAVRKVRNEILFHSSVSPPIKIADCDFSDWHPKDGDCIGDHGQPIECDDTCPQPNPYKCGGLETMKRDVVQAPNFFGMACPQLERLKKCKQFKCPIDCQMSEWSGWSKCTKDCEGGVETRTRAIMTKAKNGGEACDTVQEEISCNTGSCDRDCNLDPWTDWAPCSTACGGGITTRKKRVDVPIRGQGKCPRPKSTARFAEKACNIQDCVGDEICVAHQDLILMIDASGSLKEEGFEIVRDFSANLTDRYKSVYFGIEDMRIGVVLYGNGHLETQPDGTTSISQAIFAQGLTGDLQYVRSVIAGLTWQRGFTNMAQGFGTADTMLGQTGRADAQSAVMVISDGKFSMEFQTAEKARELKDKNVMIFMVPITETKGPELRTLKGWASQPWETNFQRIPGLTALKFNAEMFAGKIVAKFCPNAFSPSQLRQKEEQRNYMLIHESGYPSDECGAWTWLGKGHVRDDCAAAAREANRSAFAFGKGMMVGGCYTEAIEVTRELWSMWSMDRTSVPCSSGAWIANPYFDTYAIKPEIEAGTVEF
jgi:hypothetical protein